MGLVSERYPQFFWTKCNTQKNCGRTPPVAGDWREPPLVSHESVFIEQPGLNLPLRRVFLPRLSQVLVHPHIQGRHQLVDHWRF